MAEHEESGRARRGRRLGRALHAVAAPAALAAALYAGALAAASTAAGETWLRERLVAALRPRLGEVSLESVRLDARLGVTATAVRVRTADGLALEVDRARATLGLASLLAGRLEPGAVALRGVRLRQPYALGPLDVDLAASPAADHGFEASVALPGGGAAVVVATRARDGWALHAALEGVGPAALPEALRAGPTRLAAGTLSLELDAELSPGLSSARALLRGRVEGVFLDGGHAGDGAVGPLAASVSGTVGWDAASRTLSLADGVVDPFGRAPLAVEGEVRLLPGLPASLAVRAERLDLAALMAALPPGLAPPAAAPRPPGTLDARLEVAGPLADPAAWALSASLDLARLREGGRRMPAPLREPFLHRPDPSDPGSAVLVGPANPDFVPIGELPEHVVRAVTTAEDAGFFAHSGFDFDELRNALADSAEAGRLGRGGSTITQQLAKNLYLSRERTLARKAREALVAVALEGTLPKRRLLEIYLNVAEWGPGVFGIGPAARHWFAKDARELTPKEAAFLASVIPSPVRHHAMLERGRAPEAWEARVNGLLQRMSAHGALTPEELLEGLAVPITFAGG